MDIQNLSTVLEGKTIEELQPIEQKPQVSVSNLIEPTVEEVEAIIEALRGGKSVTEIRKEIRRTEGEASLGFSPEQIKIIDEEWKKKIAELDLKK